MTTFLARRIALVLATALVTILLAGCSSCGPGG
jgi:hypothetical protein